MSGGPGSNPLQVNRDLDLLAPLFAAAVQQALAECNRGANGGLRAMLYEGFRSPELQAVYYKRGRTVIPPPTPVTNARTNLESWHGFGLAVDIVHRERFWKPPEGRDWFRKVADVFSRHGCAWGGAWKKPDPPHMQWGRCAASPSDAVRDFARKYGLPALWSELEAYTVTSASADH